MRCASVSSEAPWLAGFDDQVAHLLLGPVEQLAEGAVGRPVRGDVVFGQPAAVDVAEKVVLGAGVRVDEAQVDAGADGLYCHPAILPSSFGCDDRAMSDGEPTEPPAPEKTGEAADPDDPADESGAEPAETEPTGDRVFSSYGIASTVLGVLSVAAVVLGYVHLVRSPRRGGRARLPDPRHADRRRVDGCADQHEQRQHRRQPAEAARRDGRRTQHRLRRGHAALPAGGAEAAVAERRPDRGGGDRDGAPRPGHAARWSEAPEIVSPPSCRRSPPAWTR